MRPVLKWGVIGVLVCCFAGLLWHFLRQSPAQQSDQPPTVRYSESRDPTVRPEAARTQPARDASTGRAHSTVGVTGLATATLPIGALPVAIDPAIKTMVANLKELSGTNIQLSAEAAAAWRTNLMHLVQSGPAAVPALRAFLDQKTDYPFSREIWQATGYNSSRLAAIDALRQIGGPEALSAMQGLLATTQSPREVAVLARNLEESQPGNYREQALAAARSGLQSAVQARDPNIDVAPLFEVFQHYGDASVIPDLEGARNTWNYYATIALADLPEGAGVPSLLRMAEGGAGSRVLALEMVAQLAAKNQTARDFLLAQASGNKITPNLWPYLTGPLAGDQYFPVDSAITAYPEIQSWSDVRTTHINSGNQNLYMLPGYMSLTADELNARAALVDELLKIAADPAAVQALQRARDTLARRSSQAAAQTQGSISGR